MAYRLGVAVLIASGCITSTTVPCGDRVCPNNAVCDLDHHLCVQQSQLTSCDGASDQQRCALPGDQDGIENGNCQQGVCLAIACGNGRIDLGERCDVAVVAPGKMCADDCSSDGTCGNGVTDLYQRESCDDGNFLDHDGCSSSCQLETPAWSEVIANGPRSRQFAAGAYDAGRGELVMFGGYTPDHGTLSDTWVWADNHWRAVHAAQPAGRFYAAAAYDADVGGVVMSGGISANLLTTQVDVFDGSEWKPLPSLPVGTSRHAMAYDSGRHRLVIFGGAAMGGGSNGSPITEEMGPSGWTTITPPTSPPARYAAAMAYDPKRGVIVMTGGFMPTSDTDPALDDIWEYDGTTWTNRTPGGARPAARGYATLTFMPQLGRTVLVGGLCQAATCTDAWSWSGSAWTKLAAGGAPVRDSHIAGLDDRGRIVAFGGTANSVALPGNSTTIYDGVAWAAPTAPPARANFAIARDDRHDTVLMFGGSVPTDDQPTIFGDTWRLSSAGWKKLTLIPSPSPRFYAQLVYHRTRDELVMYGGQDASFAIATGTWVFKNNAWALHNGAEPTPLLDRSLVYDGDRDRVLAMFGETAGGQVIADQWAWDGTSWTEEHPPTLPTRRAAPGLGYDELTHEILMFGGFVATGTTLNDTWVWNGTTWTEIAIPDAERPPPRVFANLTWNPARGALVLTGDSIATMDSWEWRDHRWAAIPVPDAPYARAGARSFTTRDGTGITMLFGSKGSNQYPAYQEQWELRYASARSSDVCELQQDVDGDGLAGCSDPDCWTTCTPSCPPGTTCDLAAPHCGDAICDLEIETCGSCPLDCPCATGCGDFKCEAGETAASCPGDCLM